ncbi:hypothetical protein [Shinella sp.]|uniref:hypothetical protein n=1 Tax=Shinella sp. TaxID=1870904 RepID=UPI0025878521|nr:hypothetical protein [Shinella sp.]MCW5710184.1 hypothetical protein [Shinella sp.]
MTAAHSNGQFFLVELAGRAFWLSRIRSTNKKEVDKMVNFLHEKLTKRSGSGGAAAIRLP